MHTDEHQKIWTLLEQVSDPEIPVLSIVDMGIVRAIDTSNNECHIQITPTYSGCPAMNTIATDITTHLLTNGFPCKVELVLSPAWTTDWMSAAGKQKLKAYGIAPPEDEDFNLNTLFKHQHAVECPRCNSRNTSLVSQFGSTACKALYKCLDCLEPFDYFKCLK